VEPFETVEYKGYTIELHRDENPWNPREEQDNLGTMVYGGHRYVLGDVQFGKGLDRYPWTTPSPDTHTAGEWEDWAESMGLIYLRTYAYIHGTVVMDTRGFHGRLPQGHAEFDSGHAGWIFVSREKIREWRGWKRITEKRREQIEKSLAAEVQEYSDYCQGNVCGYIIKGPDGDLDDMDDSCWGFFGDDGQKYALEEAQATIDFWIRAEEKRIAGIFLGAANMREQIISQAYA